jgi:AraC family transcriptional regulator of adaptative response / DNA-3-methyladenine glycosylase II
VVEVADPGDLDPAARQAARLCDLEVDPVAVDAHLRRDPRLSPLVVAWPGLRVPGAVDPDELCIRTMIGQQISLAGAANCAAKLVARFGEPYGDPAGGRAPTDSPATAPTRLFPTMSALAGADPASLPMPRARGEALVTMAAALADGSVDLSDGADPAATRLRLLACPGVGPWTADYVLMRGLRARDVLLTSDLVVKRELRNRGITDTRSWAPWRSYATMLLWKAWTG